MPALGTGRLFLGLSLLVTASRCGPVPPEERLFAPGRYAYQARYLPPGTRDSVTRTGFLVLTSVTPDSLVGRWEVEGYEGPLVEAYHNVVSYYVLARATSGADSVLVGHYIRGRGSDAAPECRVAVTRPDHREEGSCTLRLHGPGPH